MGRSGTSRPRGGNRCRSLSAFNLGKRGEQAHNAEVRRLAGVLRLLAPVLLEVFVETVNQGSTVGASVREEVLSPKRILHGRLQSVADLSVPLRVKSITPESKAP